MFCTLHWRKCNQSGSHLRLHVCLIGARRLTSLVGGGGGGGPMQIPLTPFWLVVFSATLIRG
jgi:hypothetical protein